MKPITLEFQAFLSYKDKVIIDFTKLDHSLFLINGDTGAGKTTIFDAMCFALYGKCTDEQRSKHLKSDFAESKENCYVDFIFTHNGKQYHIHRSPEQLRPSQKKNKQGVYDDILEAEKVIFDTPEATYSKTKEANHKIEEVINFTIGQFKQTMMIAQGKFTQLIQASTEDRSTFLREILQTEKFNEFSTRLKDRYSLISKEIEEIHAKIDNTLLTFETENEDLNKILKSSDPSNYDFAQLSNMMKEQNDDLNVEIKKIDDEKAKANELLIELNKQKTNAVASNQYLNSYNVVKNQHESLENKKAEMESRQLLLDTYDEAKEIVTNLNSYHESVKAYKDNEDIIRNAKTELMKAKEGFDKAEANYLKRDDLLEEINQEKKKIDNANSVLKKFNDLKATKNELCRLETTKSEKEEEVNGNEKKKDEKKKRQDSLKQFNLQKSENDSNLMEIKIQKQNLQSEKDNLSFAERKYSQYMKEDAKLQSLTHDLEQLYNIYEEKKITYQTAEDDYESSIAFILSKDLKEGHPCPVCGSTNHPSIAHKEHNHVEKETLDKLNAEVQEALDSVEEKKSETEKQKTAMSGLLGSIRTALKIEREENLDYIIEERKEKAAKSEEELTKKEKELNSIKSSIQANENELQQLDSEIHNLENETAELNKLIAGYDGQIKIKKEQIESLRTEIGTSNEDSINSTIQMSNRKIAETKKLIKEYEQSYTDCKTEMEKYKTTIHNSEMAKPKLQQKIDDAKAYYEVQMKKAKLPYLDNKDENHIVSFFTSYTKEEIDGLKKELAEYQNESAQNQALYETYLRNGYDKLTEIDIDSINERITAQETSCNAANEQSTRLHSKLSINEKAYNNYVSLNQTGEAKFKKYNQLKKLSEVANGTMSGTSRKDFETFYQNKVFAQILKSASRRLKNMSNNQYEMLAHHDSEGSRKTESLAIDILDNYTGKVRPANNLSGGEMFMAALSLAMGLAEISTNRNGSRELDCMFIDEGFGTLGKEYINEVVTVLKRLSEETNKMIGIISHVDYLGELISRKIIATKDVDGSKLEMKL